MSGAAQFPKAEVKSIMNMKRQCVTAAALFAVVATTGQVQAGGAEFSADMVRRGPDGEVTSGKMYVGDGRTRMEMSQQGREVVRISDQKRRMEWILFPAEQNYLERGAPPGGGQAPAPASEPSAEADPCAGTPGMNCRSSARTMANPADTERLGVEKSGIFGSGTESAGCGGESGESVRDCRSNTP